MAAVHSDDDEEIFLVSRGKQKKCQRLESSSSNEDDEESEEKTQKQKKKRKRIKTPQLTDTDSDENEPLPSCSTDCCENTPLKKKQRQRILEEMAKKKNPNYQSALKNNLVKTENKHDNEESDESSIDLEEKTRVFKAKFSKPCDLPNCSQNHVRNVTKILGVRVFDEKLGKYVGKKKHDGSETNFWVCAKHSKFWQDFSDLEEENEYSDESSSNEDDISDNFIDDSNSYESAESEQNDSNDYQAILDELRRSTPKDKKNKERYIGEHSKYQLKIHTETNPGLHLRPGVRFKRNMNTARFDKGLKEDRGIQFQDPEYQDSEDILAFGKLVKIFPRTRRVSHFNQSCGLMQCPEKLINHHTDIIGAMIECSGRSRLNSRLKPFYICYQHVRKYKNGTGGGKEGNVAEVDKIRRKLDFEEDDLPVYISSDS